MSGWLRAILLVSVTLSSAGYAAAAIKMVDEVDATVSKLPRSDCQLARVIYGMNVCRSEGSQAVRTAAYCYRTIAGVNCNDRADPRARSSSAKPQLIR